MDILFLLVPMSVLLALLIVAGLWWAVANEQFDDLDQQGARALDHD
jgi:cbb3-type cytochrome oxidase maturation protein